MLRASGAAVLLLGLVSAEDMDDLWLPTSKGSHEYSCGNCFKTVGGRASTLCNTGMHWTGGDDPFYYTDYEPSTVAGNPTTTMYDPITGASQVDVSRFPPAKDGTPSQAAPARGMTVARIKEMVGEDWPYMNCKNYLMRYKTGFLGAVAGSGAACVRAPTKAAILQADADVLLHYQKFGTSNNQAWGYPSSYAAPGKAPPNVELFGTGWGGDVPQNWCRSYMMDMLCHVAFPQVLGSVENNETGRAQYMHGRIRAVDQDSCENVMSACLRRQPPDSEPEDETAGDFTPYEMRVPTAGAFRVQLVSPDTAKYNLPAENMSMEVLKFCKLWKGGYGLARAGTGVASEEGQYPAQFPVATYDPTLKRENNYWDHATWDASSSTTASLLLVIATTIAATLGGY